MSAKGNKPIYTRTTATTTETNSSTITVNQVTGYNLEKDAQRSFTDSDGCYSTPKITNTFLDPSPLYYKDSNNTEFGIDF